MIKWLFQRRLLRSIAKYAMKEFKKRKKYDEHLPEQQIAHEIFKSRFLDTKRQYPEREKYKIQKYIDANFYPNNIIEFCLASLDIEGNVTPSNSKDYSGFAKDIESIMVSLGYPYEKSTHDVFFKKPDLISSRIYRFVGRWYDAFF
jgi:hypothetical protein